MKSVVPLVIIVGILALGIVIGVGGCRQKGPEALLAPEPIQTVALGQNREFLVNSKQFLPIMCFLVDAEELPQAKAVGMNTAEYFWRSDSPTGGADAYAEACRKLNLYFIAPFDTKFSGEMKLLASSPTLLGWVQQDEPELSAHHISPEELMVTYRAIKALDPMRPVLLGVSPNLIHDTLFLQRRSRAEMDLLYPEMLRSGDVVGLDTYPYSLWNRPDKIAWASQGLDDLRSYAGRNKPSYETIETMGHDEEHPLTGVEMRNEVWQAIIHGATAICYFTHKFEPVHKSFGVSEANQKAMLEINRQLTKLTPVILAADAREQPWIKIEDKVAAQCLAKESGGWLYIFAQNIDGAGKAGRGTIWWSGLKAGTKIEVVDENRTLEATSGQFSDDFLRLAVHIYRMKL